MRAFILLIFIFLLLGCSEKASEKSKFTEVEIASLMLDSTQLIQVKTDSIININLNPFLKQREFNLGEMIKDIRFIPLETTDESLISNIDYILVTDSNIYIADSYKGGSVLIFDNQGDFIKRIDRGQGPNEIIKLKNFAFDKNSNELIVFHNHYFSFFTRNGEFKQRKRIPLNAYSFAVIPDGYLFHSIHGMDNRHINLEDNYQLLITNKSFQLKYVGLSYLSCMDGINLEGNTRYIHLNTDTVNVTFKLNDTIYQYVDYNTIRAKEILNINDRAIPKYLLFGDNESFLSALRQNNYYFFLGEYVENQTHEYYQLANFHINKATFIFREKKTGICIGGTDCIVDRSKYPVLNAPIASQGSYFISYYLPGDEYANLPTNEMIPENVVKKLKTLSSDDNPVLVFYELKTF